MSCRSNFTAHKREACALASVLMMGTFSIYCMTKESDIKLAELLVYKVGDVTAEFHYEDAPATSNSSSLRNHLLSPLLTVK